MYLLSYLFFFFNDTATTEIYTLSLHDALPISVDGQPAVGPVENAVLVQPRKQQLAAKAVVVADPAAGDCEPEDARSEEHTSELQSRQYLVCRLLLEKKKKTNTRYHYRPIESFQ